ncbi:hypothetical protein [Pontixanthobacter sp. CEM42]|uniref:hypothetical protein n=1 Tax=Pontixanthobacter sp. CEM42 TaxID=2792077 RepID=UPI001AE03AEE|nr:hypothetical protein [Pontixanthobacter sp. CEM42]
MSEPDINQIRDRLLLELVRRNATNQKPMNPLIVSEEIWPDVDWKNQAATVRSAAFLLTKNEPKFAKRVIDSEGPGLVLIAQTAAGKSAAAHLEASPETNTSPSRDWTKIGAIAAWIMIPLTILGLVIMYCLDKT